ncbi:MAG: 6-carboxytetrahydropterin synthase QueD [Eubacterium sp.]|nr:6-carboxytetrahydropterin synthase QueD [Eubacterium sp.]
MYYLKTEASFDAAHFLADYEGKCRNIHGHRWRVVVEIQSETLRADAQNRGMVVDFGDLKKALKALCDSLDHSLIIETGSLKAKTLEALREENFAINELDFRPTAENFAHYVFDKLGAEGYPIHRVEVYETPNNCAIYEA